MATFEYPLQLKSAKPKPVEFKNTAKPSFKSPFGKPDDRKYLLLNPKKPYVKARDGELRLEDGRLAKDILPEELKGHMTQEEWEVFQDTTFESCEQTYKNLKAVIDAPKPAIEEFGKEPKMIPFLPEYNKFKALTNMIVEDMRFLTKELNSIRALYKMHLDKDGKTKEGIIQTDAYYLNKITDIKLRYFVAGTRIKNLIEPSMRHLADFHLSMEIRYYMAHPEETPPERLQRFMKERLKHFTNTKPPKPEPETPKEETTEEPVVQEYLEKTEEVKADANN